jgi:hypothetical protein
LPYPAEHIATMRARGDADQARHLFGLDEHGRAAWLGRKPQSTDVNWWLSQFAVVDERIRQSPEPAARIEWIGLRWWLLGEAEGLGVFGPRESTERRTWFAAWVMHLK